MLTVQEGCYPTEIATALPPEGRSEERRKLNVWTRPREREAIQPCSHFESAQKPQRAAGKQAGEQTSRLTTPKSVE